ncbi:MAG: hypothetical protein E6Q73_00375 [Pseudorhodobacter sp.]|nr:MAG: hypothetical protein E6Q73_00375 [Pseudorhodobacter sp.]
MLAGTVVSAVFGGLVGLCFAMVQDHGVVQSLLSYQLGGMFAVLAFLMAADRRTQQPARPR